LGLKKPSTKKHIMGESLRNGNATPHYWGKTKGKRGREELKQEGGGKKSGKNDVNRGKKRREGRHRTSRLRTPVV